MNLTNPPLNPVANLVQTAADRLPGTRDKPIAASTTSSISDLRLPVNYGSGVTVQKILANTPIRKPAKDKFFKTRPGEESTFDCLLLDLKETGEKYLVTEQVAGSLDGLCRPNRVHLAIDRENNIFLIPVVLPGEDGRWNLWHKSLAAAVKTAEEKWVRLVANMAQGSYDVYVAQADLGEPNWPAYTLTEVVEDAFKDKVLRDLDHPVVRGLLGRE